MESARTGDVVVAGSRRITGEQLLQRASALARALADQGIEPGKTVAYLHGNSAESVIARLAVQSLGACYVGLRPFFSTGEKLKFLLEGQPELFVFDPDQRDEAASLCSRAGISHALSIGDCDFGENVLDLAEEKPDAPLECSDRDGDISMVTFSSGSTGEPKGIAHTFASASGFLDNARHMYGPGPWRFLVAIPLSDLGGEIVQWTLAGGGTAVLVDDFHAGEVAAILGRERITHFFGSPSMVHALVHDPGLQDAELPDLRLVAYGGAPSSPSRIADAVAALGPVLMHNYGMQEAGFISFLDRTDHVRTERYLLNSVGRPLPGVEIAIRNAEGRELPAGSIGEVCLRSPTIMAGYWRRPDLTSQVLRAGWFHTGDLGRTDDEGYLYLVDRVKDIIIVDAYNVYPQQVEQVLTAHPGVAQAVVVGLPDPDTGESVYAAVVPSVPVPAGRTAEFTAELTAAVRETLGSVHQPTRVDLLSSMPLTPRGKPDKAAIRGQAAGAAGALRS
ncbi:AMP-binding protein [Nocardiopsis sp. NPDC058631]|uniref:AMP-binding protein n=1 Tax=Nocardiopsis sp. NPDC058631 TaxID=3346566 RepID=UPI003665A114